MVVLRYRTVDKGGSWQGKGLDRRRRGEESREGKEREPVIASEGKGKQIKNTKKWRNGGVSIAVFSCLL